MDIPSYKEGVSEVSNQEHLFRLKGNMQLSCYCSLDKTTLREVLSTLAEDVKTQFKFRLEILEEEAQSNSKNLLSYL